MNILLYIMTCLIWGSTWYAIKLQNGVVPPIWSVAYRFAIAAILLLSICLLLKRCLRFTLRQHRIMALQGLVLCCINYILFYYSEIYLVSGVVALIGASISIMNILNSRLLLGSRSSLSTILGSVIGVAGLVMVLWAEIIGLAHSHTDMSLVVLGIVLAVVATYSASLGNIISAHSQKQHIPVLQSNFFSMLYGCVFTALLALLFKQPLKFDFSWSYAGPLLYLALFGSVIAFQTYLSLLGRIGPARAAYIFVITPVLALLLSTYLEGFSWHLYNVLGVALIVAGNILIMKTSAKSRHS